MSESASTALLLGLCRRIVKLCADAFPTLDLPRDDESARLRAALFARALEHFHGVLQLAEVGLSSPARVVVRSLLEVSFYDAALASGKLTAEELFAQHDHWRLKLSNKARHQFSPELRYGLEGVTDEHQEELRDRIARAGVPELNIAEVARRGGREDEYWLMFESFSATVHVTTRDVAKHLVERDDGGLQLLVGSQPPDPQTLQVAATTMLRMTVSLAELVGVDIMDEGTELMTALARLAASQASIGPTPPNKG